MQTSQASPLLDAELDRPGLVRGISGAIKVGHVSRRRLSKSLRRQRSDRQLRRLRIQDKHQRVELRRAASQSLLPPTSSSSSSATSSSSASSSSSSSSIPPPSSLAHAPSSSLSSSSSSSLPPSSTFAAQHVTSSNGEWQPVPYTPPSSSASSSSTTTATSSSSSALAQAAANAAADVFLPGASMPRTPPSSAFYSTLAAGSGNGDAKTQPAYFPGITNPQYIDNPHALPSAGFTPMANSPATSASSSSPGSTRFSPTRGKNGNSVTPANGSAGLGAWRPTPATRSRPPAVVRDPADDVLSMTPSPEGAAHNIGVPHARGVRRSTPGLSRGGIGEVNGEDDDDDIMDSGENSGVEEDELMEALNNGARSGKRKRSGGPPEELASTNGSVAATAPVAQKQDSPAPPSSSKKQKTHDAPTTAAAAAAASASSSSAKPKEQAMAASPTDDLREHYELVRYLGHGSYGRVFLARHLSTGTLVAIKNIPKIFENFTHAKRLLRELRILRMLQHENVIEFREIIEPSDMNEFSYLLLVFEYVETDMAKLINSEQFFTNQHIQFFLYQILVSLKYIHSANIIHRDLKPANLLVNGDCSLKICDFGLARGCRLAETSSGHLARDSESYFSRTVSKHLEVQHSSLDPHYHAHGASPSVRLTPAPSKPNSPPLPPLRRQLTKHVVTRWYRAPELILLSSSYTSAIDMWSVGCILAEMLSMQQESVPKPALRTALFPGRSCYPLSADDARAYTDNLDQMNVIFDVIGSPTPDELDKLTPKARKFLAELPSCPRKDLREMYPGADPMALKLLESLLQFDPDKRPTAEEALGHPYLASVRGIQEETTTNPIDFEFEDIGLTKEDLKKLIKEEVAFYHPQLQLQHMGMQ